MKSEDVKLELKGESKPPADLDMAARETLGAEKYDEFKRLCPNEFTPKQLVDFLEGRWP